MSQNEGSNGVDGTKKLGDDLDAVMERVELCREMMLESPGIQHDETLAGVVGFLEACRDRMAELIDAGAQGQLTEELFERCLTVNDAIHRTLEAEKTGTKIAVKDRGSEAVPKSPKPLIEMGPDVEEEEEDERDRPVRKIAPSVSSPVQQQGFSKPKSKVDDSLLAPYVPPPAAVPAPAPAVDPFTNSADPFADFTTSPIELPPAPVSIQAGAVSTTTTQPAPAAGNSSAGALADLESLLGATSVSPPAAPVPVPTHSPALAPAPAGTPQAQAAADFDAFLDSLGETPAK